MHPSLSCRKWDWDLMWTPFPLFILLALGGPGAAAAEESKPRFLQHVLPHRFTKVRSYGLLSPRCRQALERARSLLRRRPNHPRWLHGENSHPANLLLYPRVRVWTVVPIGFFLTSFAFPAWTMLLYWLLLQVLSGVLTFGGESVGGVAFWAHVGGFGAGLALIKLFARDDYVREHRRVHWEPHRVGWRR